jgi:hypothetical protein
MWDDSVLSATLSVAQGLGLLPAGTAARSAGPDQGGVAGAEAKSDAQHASRGVLSPAHSRAHDDRTSVLRLDLLLAASLILAALLPGLRARTKTHARMAAEHAAAIAAESRPEAATPPWEPASVHDGQEFDSGTVVAPPPWAPGAPRDDTADREDRKRLESRRPPGPRHGHSSRVRSARPPGR